MLQQEKSIAIFDSGVGGLSVMRELVRLLPEENIIYFADTARVPYGGKSDKTIRRFSRECLQYLSLQNIKCIILASHTISSLVLEEARAEFPLPLFGIIEPSVDLLLQSTKNQRIAILATVATLHSKKYQQLVKERLPEIEMYMVAAPLLVPLIEEGWADHPITYEIVREYLLPLREKDIDTLLLGCTHYKFVQKDIELLFDKKVAIIDSSEIFAQKIANQLGELKLLGQESQPIYRFIVTDLSDKFQKIGEHFLGRSIPLMEVQEIAI